MRMEPVALTGGEANTVSGATPVSASNEAVAIRKRCPSGHGWPARLANRAGRSLTVEPEGPSRRTPSAASYVCPGPAATSSTNAPSGRPSTQRSRNSSTTMLSVAAPAGNAANPKQAKPTDHADQRAGRRRAGRPVRGRMQAPGSRGNLQSPIGDPPAAMANDLGSTHYAGFACGHVPLPGCSSRLRTLMSLPKCVVWAIPETGPAAGPRRAGPRGPRDPALETNAPAKETQS